MAEKIQKTPPKGRPKSLKTYTHEKPHFVSLKQGDSMKGIFMGTAPSQFGPAYKFRLEDGNLVHLGGNRTQLDSIMDEILTDVETFGMAGAKGHLFEVRRGIDAKTEAGRTVGVYEISHLDGCPLGCVGF